MSVENVSREDWIIGGLALLLVIDLLFLPWFSVLGRSRLTATDAPDGWLGVLAVLAADRADRRSGRRAVLAADPAAGDQRQPDADALRARRAWRRCSWR